MKRFNIIKDRIATNKEVFDYLKNGGEKLLCENLTMNNISEVEWYQNGMIKISTIEKNNHISHYYSSFNYVDLTNLQMNSKMFSSDKVWYIGHIEEINK